VMCYLPIARKHHVDMEGLRSGMQKVEINNCSVEVTPCVD
jgi:hypothetical protein